MSTAIRHSPPSSPAPGAPNKRARIGDDSPMADHATTSEMVPAVAKPIPAKAKAQGGKKRAQKKHITPIDPVLLVDILQTLGWESLPVPQQPASEAETLGQRLWPKEAPARFKRHLKPGPSSVVEDAAMDPDGSTEWKFTEAEFKVVNLTSHGDGIAIHPREGPPEWAVIIPFTLPGDVVKAKVTRNLYYHSFAEPVALPSRSSYEPPTVAGTAASPSTFPLPLHRDPSLPQCRYFSTCAGCQYQWLSYAEQLAIKRLVVQKAMRNFSGLEEGVDWPEVGETIPSPKQYGYRTKITPHFDLPKELQTGKKGRRAVQKTPKQSQSATTQINEEEVSNEGIVALQPAHPEFGDLPIGFNEACRSKIMDIEECPIATEVINERLPAVRQEVKLNIREYKRGATLLFRDSLVVKGQQVDAVKSKDKGKAIEHVDKADVLDDRVCITAHHQTITEKVGDIVFQFPAGSFFQNNSSILVPLTDYVKSQVADLGVAPRPDGGETFLVDAYCGSGLFSLTLASSFTRVLGIEIDPQSISYATHNATINGIPNASFHAGASEHIFESAILELEGKADRTTLIVDPPRKGCDEAFLGQVVAFRPKVVVYVSCNVHTMAENVGTLIRLTSDALRAEGKDPAQEGYRIMSVRAIDLFPQTHHAEGLLVLMRGD